MAKKQKEVTTLMSKVAEFIRNHKKTGTATDDEINNVLVIPFALDAEGIEKSFATYSRCWYCNHG